MASEPLEKDRDVNVAPRRFGPILCDHCASLFSALETVQDGQYVQVNFYDTLRSFENSVRSGCRLCIILNYNPHRKGIHDSDYSPLEQRPLGGWKLKSQRQEGYLYYDLEAIHEDSTPCIIRVHGERKEDFAYSVTSRQ